MSQLQHRLIVGWRECNVDTPPYLFPGDEAVIMSKSDIAYASFNEFVKSSSLDAASDTKLHIGLLPIPYIGNLERASVFLLMSNPGFSLGDYIAEQNVQAFKDAQVRSLRQENIGDKYPFIFLDPAFTWHPGFEYWHRKLRHVIEALVNQKHFSYEEAMAHLAQSIACMELTPYHSKKYSNSRVLKSLPSASAMIDYVRKIIAPQAYRNEVTLVVARGAADWVLSKHGKVVVLDGKAEARQAHFTLNSPGGKAIAEALGLAVSSQQRR